MAAFIIYVAEILITLRYTDFVHPLIIAFEALLKPILISKLVTEAAPPPGKVHIYNAIMLPLSKIFLMSPYAIPKARSLNSLTKGHVFEPSNNYSAASLANIFIATLSPMIAHAPAATPLPNPIPTFPKPDPTS